MFTALLATPVLRADQPSRTVAKQVVVPVVTIEAAHQQYWLGTVVEALEDRDQRWTLDSILTSEMQQRFVAIRGTYPNFSYTSSAYWLRCTVVSAQDILPHEWLIAAYYPSLEHVDFTIITPDGRRFHTQSGATIPLAEKILEHRYHLAYLPPMLHGDTLRVFIRVASRMTTAIPLDIITQRRLVENESVQMIPVWLYFGIALAMCCYNGFLAFTLRDKAYLFYVLYIVFYGAFMFVSVNALVFQYFPAFAGLVPTLVTCLSLSGNVAALFFMRTFLRLRHLQKAGSWLQWWFTGLVWVNGLAFAAQWFVPIQQMHRSLNLIALMAIALVLTAAVVAVRAKYRPAIFFLTGWLFFLAGGIVFVLSNLAILPKTPMFQFSVQLGSAVEMMLLSLALTDRIAILRRERENARAEALNGEIYRLRVVELAEANEEINRQKALLEEQTQETEIANRQLVETNDSLHQAYGDALQHQELAEARARELTALNEEVVHAKLRAEESDRLKSEFLGNLSHEIRTPLTAIMGFAEIARDHATAEVHGYIERIVAAGNTLLRLFTDMLELSKVEAGTLVVSLGEVNVADLCERVHISFASEAAAKGVELSLAVSSELPPALLLDVVKLRQTMQHLVGNAVKFTRQGFIRVSVQAASHPWMPGLEEPDLEERVNGDVVDVRIVVQDSGIGIAADKQASIFHAFRQQDGNTTRSYGGLGVGLTIAHHLVEAMGGSITVESELGIGSTFTILLRDVSIIVPVSSQLESPNSSAIGSELFPWESGLVAYSSIRPQCPPRLLALIDDVFLPLWQSVLPRMNNLDIEEFGRQLLEAGAFFDVEPLQRYGTELRALAVSLKLVEMEREFRAFSQLVEPQALTATPDLLTEERS